jgi:hypothetical protein
MGRYLAANMAQVMKAAQAKSLHHHSFRRTWYVVTLFALSV